MLSPDTVSSLRVAVGAASVPFNASMTAGQFWLFVSNANCWIRQGNGTPVAAASAGSMYVPANTLLIIWGNAGDNLAVIQDGTSTGNASLTRANRV